MCPNPMTSPSSFSATIAVPSLNNDWYLVMDCLSIQAVMSSLL
uniref:Uncharacterized protein n=1 Tax=Amphimedon queenslandica TaxID=400682 RepID=A0A1X7VPW2_AMPQE